MEGGGGGGGVIGNGGNGNGGGFGGGGGGTVAGTDGGSSNGGVGGGGGGNGGCQNQNGFPGSFLGGGGGGGVCFNNQTLGNGGAGGTYGGGGGGAESDNGSQVTGQGGGAGGDFGGGGGACGLAGPGTPNGGAGGFGGGGGGGGNGDGIIGFAAAGPGGFGGGSGGDAFVLVPAGLYGGAGGHIAVGGGGGGGGAALGGTIFVRATNGASLTFIDSSTDAGTLTAGAGGSGSALQGGDVAAQSGQTAGSSMFLLGGNYVFTVNQPSSTISGDISGWTGAPVSVNKTGPGTLVLPAVNSYSWSTLVSSGALEVDGSLAGGITVNNGGTLSGSGSVGAVTLNGGGTLFPGSGTGTLTAGNMIWLGSGNYNWRLADATGVPGVGSSLLQVNGSLDVSGAAGFNINVASLTTPLHFTTPTNYTWTLVQTTGGIVGFNPANFNIITSAFSNPFGTGTFSLSVAGNNLVLSFQPSPPSVTTQPAVPVLLTQAVLNGLVNPNGTPAAAWFQYGLTTNYGAVSSTNLLGSGTNIVTISNLISGLQQATVYHFRVVAANGVGLTNGNDASFLTLVPFSISSIKPGPGATTLLQFNGTAGAGYTLQNSTNLINWSGRDESDR